MVSVNDFILIQLEHVVSYLDIADSALLEGALGHVVGADVPIFTPVAGERAAYA